MSYLSETMSVYLEYPYKLTAMRHNSIGLQPEDGRKSCSTGKHSHFDEKATHGQRCERRRGTSGLIESPTPRPLTSRVPAPTVSPWRSPTQMPTGISTRPTATTYNKARSFAFRASDSWRDISESANRAHKARVTTTAYRLSRVTPMTERQLKA